MLQVTNLAWGYENFRVGFERTQNSAETQDLLAWGADYLVSAWNADTKSFVAVVGDNTTDFNYYGPIEEYQYYNKRPTWYADNENPGNELCEHGVMIVYRELCLRVACGYLQSGWLVAAAAKACYSDVTASMFCM